MPHLLLIFLLSILTPTGNTHALYLSTLELSQEPGEGRAEIRIKVFADDLRDALRHAWPEAEIAPEERLCQENSRELERYFQRHVAVELDETRLVLQWQGGEKQGEVIWLHFAADCLAGWRQVSVRADYFMELFPSQSNIIHLRYGAEKRLFRLQRGEVEKTLMF